MATMMGMWMMGEGQQEEEEEEEDENYDDKLSSIKQDTFSIAPPVNSNHLIESSEEESENQGKENFQSCGAVTKVSGSSFQTPIAPKRPCSKGLLRSTPLKSTTTNKTKSGATKRHSSPLALPSSKKPTTKKSVENEKKKAAVKKARVGSGSRFENDDDQDHLAAFAPKKKCL